MSSQLFPKFLGVDANVKRNGFDRSRREVFSAKCGLLIPTNIKHVMPGTEGTIDIRHILRTDAIQTAAFTRFDVDYSFYKVNYNDIYSGFNQYVAQREDKQLSSTPSTDSLPSFYLNEFVRLLLPYALNDYLKDYPFTFVNPYNSKETIVVTSENYSIVNDNFVDQSVCLEVVRNLDMMGYGNYLPRIVAWIESMKYVFSELSKLDTLEPFYDRFVDEGVYRDEKYFVSFFKFLQIFADGLRFVIDNIGTNPDLAITIQNLLFSKAYSFDEFTPELFYTNEYFHIEEVQVNLWTPCAFNKIFENHFRNPYYDFKFNLRVIGNHIYNPFNIIEFFPVSYDYVKLFNLDDFGDDIDHYGLWFPRLVAIFAPKYSQYPKDIFTGVLPSTQFGDVSVMTDDRSFLNLTVQPQSANVSGVSNLTARVSALESTEVGLSNTVSPAKFRFDPALAISVLNQRRADALQRFNENMMRAGNRTKALFRAHFGFEPKSEQGHEAYYLGSFSGRIDLNTVTSTSESEATALGQQGSVGVGTVEGNKIHFKSDDFAVILSIFNIKKPAEYDSFGLDRFNEILDKWDFPYSELQNISLAPLDRLRLTTSTDAFDEQIDIPRILGYLPRFIEYKSDVDVIHGEFYSQSPYAISLIGNGNGVFPKFRLGLFSNYVTPRNDLDAAASIRFLYCLPDSVNNVFYYVQNCCQSTDPFKINMQCDFFVTENLSVIGLPY